MVHLYCNTRPVEHPVLLALYDSSTAVVPTDEELILGGLL